MLKKILRRKPDTNTMNSKLNSFLKEVTDFYFSDLIDLQVKSLSLDTNIKPLLQTAKQEYLKSLKNECFDNLVSSIDYNLDKTIEVLKSVFIKKDDNINTSQVQIFSDEVSIVANAILNVLLWVPIRYFGANDQVPEAVKESILSIFKSINDVRNTYELKDIRKYDAVSKALFRKIAQADDYIWLPLSPLVTAPLKEDLELYARDHKTSYRLAKNIVKSDGVTLICGYRGVGKTTYINNVINHLGKAEELQVGETPWKVVPVYLSIAKADGNKEILKLCLRRLYEVLFSDKWQHLLKKDEKQHLLWAYKRASFDVNINELESMTNNKSFQFVMDFDLSNLTQVKLLPKVRGEKAISHKRQFEHTLKLLDYTEEKAEEDIIRTIELLSRPRLQDDGKENRYLFSV